MLVGNWKNLHSVQWCVFKKKTIGKKPFSFSYTYIDYRRDAQKNTREKKRSVVCSSNCKSLSILLFDDDICSIFRYAQEAIQYCLFLTMTHFIVPLEFEAVTDFSIKVIMHVLISNCALTFPRYM